MNPPLRSKIDAIFEAPNKFAATYIDAVILEAEDVEALMTSDEREELQALARIINKRWTRVSTYL